MAGWKRKRRGVCPGGGRRPAGRPPDDDDDDGGGATELDAGAEIDVGSGGWMKLKRRRWPRGRQDSGAAELKTVEEIDAESGIGRGQQDGAAMDEWKQTLEALKR